MDVEPEPKRRATYALAITSENVAEPRLTELEGLRGVAAFLIVLFHAASQTAMFEGELSPVARVVQHFNVGVPIFFVLSGFLLYRPFVAAHLRAQPAPAVGWFLLRRAARILPAFWIALVVSAWAVEGITVAHGWYRMRYLTLTNIYWRDTSLGGLMHVWSLATELAFYLALPLLAWLTTRVRGSVERKVRVHYAVAGLLIVMSFVFRAVISNGGHTLGYQWLPAHFDTLGFGMALAVAAAARRAGVPEPSALRWAGRHPGLTWFGAAICYCAVIPLDIETGLVTLTFTQEMVREVLFFCVAVGLVAPLTSSHRRSGTLARTLASRPLVAFGTVSYGVYLWHVVVIEVLRAEFPVTFVLPVHNRIRLWLVVAAAGTAVTLVVATISWFAVERPLIELARSPRGRASQASSAARAAASSDALR